MASGDSTPPPPAGSGGFTVQGVVTLAVAVLVLIGYAVFVGYMWGERTTANETAWNRAVFLFTGVETIVFAAVGFLFGKEVHRQQAVNAEGRARSAEADAKASQAKGAKGEALAAAVKGLAGSVAAHPETIRRMNLGIAESKDAAAQDAAGPHHLTALASMAEELFPTKP